VSLKLQLKAGQKIIINGAVIENGSPKVVTLFLRNRASILRDSEIITEDDAVTPASRIYYIVQCVYLFPDEANKNLLILNRLVQDYLIAAPSSHAILHVLIEWLEKGDPYQALRAARDLIQHEGVILHHGQQSADELSDSSSGGELP
jgi:flagellar protein FlbT